VLRDESGETDGTFFYESEDFNVSEETWATVGATEGELTHV
jgi:hypothetical protein